MRTFSEGFQKSQREEERVEDEGTESVHMERGYHLRDLGLGEQKHRGV